MIFSSLTRLIDLLAGGFIPIADILGRTNLRPSF
jgi:hypothetical protein